MVLAAGSLLLTGAGGQQPPPASESVQSNLPQPEWVKLYGGEQGVTEPKLIQPEYALQSECKGQKSEGSVKLSFVVDSEGQPRNVVFGRALANGIDLIALKLLLKSRFEPAVLNGSPVAVGRSVEMRLQVCAEESKDQSDETGASIRLRLPPEERFEDWHHPPVQANLAPIAILSGVMAEKSPTGSHFTAAKILIAAKRPDAKGRSGDFFVSFIVDEHGIPRSLVVLKATDQTLLPQVLQCVRNTRYQPALNDGMPVPAHYTMGINFRSY